MKIAFILPNSLNFIGGAEVFVKMLADALKRHGHEVSVFAFSDLKLNLSQKIILSAMRFFPYRELYKAKLLGAHFNKKNNGFDVVISSDYYGYYAKAPKKIMLLHDCYRDIFESIRHKISYPYYLWGQHLGHLQEKSMKKSDIVVVFSRHVKDYVTSRGLKEPILIHHGIDTRKFRPIKNARSKLSLDLPKNFLLYVGSNAPWKNVETVIKTADFYKVVFLSRADPESEKVQWIKSVKDSEMPLLYNCADILLHPAYHEGFGYAVAEAMACGTPPIFTRTGYGDEIADAIPEIILNKPDDTAEITEKISYILENRSKISKKCRNFIKRNNDVVEWEKKFLKIIEE
ncbi:MAG: glycosyltransferase family 4 protein [Candidatus Diapherotrites archaeon]|nr:glycosyltransferase family 4 protein [Candidatus Diapherotrites archaeon]